MIFYCEFLSKIFFAQLYLPTFILAVNFSNLSSSLREVYPSGEGIGAFECTYDFELTLFIEIT